MFCPFTPQTALTSQGIHILQKMFLLNRYDSLTGVPVSQQNLLLEKASILFSIGALYAQMGTRCNQTDRSWAGGMVDSFQRAAGMSQGALPLR